MRAQYAFLSSAWLAAAAALSAHPMGNFSVSHYTRLEVSRTRVEVTYVLDLAEVPTYILLRDWKLDAKSPQPQLESKAAEQARQWAEGLEFEAGGRKVEPAFVRAEIKLSDGAGGLAVARIASILELKNVRAPLTFEDRNYPERAGWKEIVIRSGAGASIVKASHGEEERSKALTEYPADPTAAPPQDLRASVDWTATDRPVVSQRRGAGPALAEPGDSTRPAASDFAAPRVSEETRRIAPISQPPAFPAAAAAPPPSSGPASPQSPGTIVKGDYLSRLISMKTIPLGWL
ncbi:MAG TPA: hypothetical protein VKV74_05520, partial [Bryobacteraceae bacterium]|nr:hypothetical protein [Bryobacteraceae bacterium]